MKTILLLAIVISGSFVNAEIVTGEANTYAFIDGRRCDIERIPEATKAAVDAALKNASKACLNLDVLAARILSVEPTGCRTWTPIFHAIAEIEFNCVR